MWPSTHRRLLARGLASLLAISGPVHAGGAFKVCADPNNPPFSDDKGQGFENKIAELFAKELGQKLEYTWFPQRLGFIRNTLKAKIEDSEEYKCDVVMGVPEGYELTATTPAYYRSTYALVYAKGKGFDAIKTAADLDQLPADQKTKLRIAMFDGAPGTTWLLNHQLIGQGIPYQTMTGDVSTNTAQVLDRDFKAGKIDMVIVWGPIAGYLASRNPLAMIPMKSEPGLKFDFPIAMGVRFPDKERKAQLEGLLKSKAGEIQAILKEYKVPLVDAQGNPVP